MIINSYDAVIVGGGLAGIVSAIELAENGLKVAILDNQKYDETASHYAQGGIAAIISEQDSIDLHLQDTYIASGKIADIEAITKVVSDSPDAIAWLENHGMVFDRNKNGDYSLHLEGGHSLKRILHVKDFTGKAIVSSLYKVITNNKNITIFNPYSAFKLITENNQCTGLYAYNLEQNKIESFLVSNVILASGGASGIYKYVTNPTAGMGNSMIMAYEIGCELENLEFTQFHPTCFFCNDNKPLLISEAIRGSGATLEQECGLKIMRSIHPQRDLAPRDIVARQIYKHMQMGQDIYLNATHLNGTQWQEKFPYIYKQLLANGIDPTQARIPISPAAHYSCGGIKVGSNSQTNVKNLYVVGEVSCTGLHGSNRLASNSLLECIVYGLASSSAIISNGNTIDMAKTITMKTDVSVINTEYEFDHYIIKIKQIMWDYVGLVRNEKKLLKAKDLLAEILNESKIDSLNDFNYEYDTFKKLLQLAILTVESALIRKESVGSHFIDDNLV